MTNSPSIRPSTFVALSALAFTILFSYSIARTVVESLFLGAYTDKTALPLAWVAVAIATTLAVTIYNYYAASVDLLRLLLAATAVSIGTLVLLAASHASGVPHMAFGLYLWKDVYIVILFEVLLSFANVVFGVRSARRGYGLFLLLGSLGDVSGNLSLHRLLKHFSTAQLLWAPILPLACLLPLGLKLGQLTGFPKPPSGSGRRPSPAQDLALLRGSSYLLWLLALIGIVQVVITLIDYDYNRLLQASFPTDTDARTTMGTMVYGMVSVSTVALQSTAAVVLRFIGIPATLYTVPLLVTAGMVGFSLFGGFWFIAAAKIASKALDYSLFRAAKEILYIPLSYAEKTRGKALIDMLTYRMAKGGASLLLLGLLALSWRHPTGSFTLLLLAGWVAVSVPITRRYRALVSRDEER